MKDLDWELFDRYLAGAATPADREEFERWLSERPERAGFLAAWHRGLATMESEMAAADRDAVWSGALERVGDQVGVSETPGPNRLKLRPARFTLAEPHPRRWRVGGALGAAGLVVAGTVLVGRLLIKDSGPDKPVAERVVTVPRGQRVRFRLPDGSEVLLAAGSTLRHPQVFPDRLREVTLQGEAYFTVEHESRRQFQVRAGDLIATDLGTEFLVRAYPEDSRAQVVVRSGAVAVRPARTARASGEGQVVRPGELGRIGPDDVLQVERVDTAAYFAWIEGTLVFDGTPLRQALPQLSRWYNLEFQLADTSLGAIPLSGTLDQTLTEARLDLLAGSLGLKQVRRGNVVTLSRADGR